MQNRYQRLLLTKSLIVLGVAVIAMLIATNEGRAQLQGPTPPRLSASKAQLFPNNPAANPILPRMSPAAAPPRQQTAPTQAPVAGGTWQASTPGPTTGMCNPLLLTDGTVIVADCHFSPGKWYKLTPDVTGSYINGSWSQIASLPSGYGPLAFASAVLPDGRVVIEGGEFNEGVNDWTNLGAIYDPVANAWTPVSPPDGGTGPWVNIGDAPGIVLPNGTFMLGNCCYPPGVALFNAATLGWTDTGIPPEQQQSEAGYTLMQNGKVLTLNPLAPPAAYQYDPAIGTWSSLAPTPVSLIDPAACGTWETGPALTRPDGTVVAFGGNTGCTASPADPTAVYTPSSNTWIQGPNVPAVCGAGGNVSCTLPDAPAALLPNGNILFAASAGNNEVGPTHFFEFTAANTINQVSDPDFASLQVAAAYNFLVLPTGQILANDSTEYMEIYTPTGSPNPAWAPTITSVPNCVAPGSSYIVSGTQLNGLSQGAAFGDDFQSATNYPLVRIINDSTGHVFYARTHGHSTMAIAPGQAGSTNFDVASATEIGLSTLYVVTNGISSTGSPVTVTNDCASLKTATHDFNADGKSDIAWRDTGGDAAVWLMNGTQVIQSASVGSAPTVWTIVGQRDFDADGKYDWLWRDTSGNVAIWFLNGAQVAQSAGVGSVATTWSVAGTADFNGDGKGDILWHDTSGNVAIWVMDGARVIASAGVGAVDPNVWKIVGTGDFNGDGKADILWRDGNGNVAIWFMSGAAVIGSAGVGNVPAVWSIAGTGDFNGDGKYDIVWRDSSGNVAIWLMNGAQVTQSAGVGSAATVWSIVETGDFDGNGKSDLLWQDSSGNVAIWFMNGAQVAQAAGVGNVPISVWSIQNANAD